MPPRERAADRGARLARQDLVTIGAELRRARIGAGLTLAAVGRACGMSSSQVGRIERAVLRSATSVQLARIGAVVGLDVRLKAYPGPSPVRDVAQLAVMGRFAAAIHPALRMPVEVPVVPGEPGQQPWARDQRAWDGVLSGWLIGPDDPMPAEFDSRLYDFQAQVRRLQLKRRDGNVEEVLWIVANTHANRRAAREAATLIDELFPLPARAAMRALREGRRPKGSALIFV